MKRENLRSYPLSLPLSWYDTPHILSGLIRSPYDIFCQEPFFPDIFPILIVMVAFVAFYAVIFHSYPSLAIWISWGMSSAVRVPTAKNTMQAIVTERRVKNLLSIIIMNST